MNTNKENLNRYSWFKLGFELLAACSIVFSIVWSILIDKHAYRWQKMVETQHVLEQIDHSHWKYIGPVLDKIKDSTTLNRYVIQDSIVLIHVRDQLAIYENLSIGHNIGIYDAEVINRFIGYYFVTFHEKITPYIINTRKTKKRQSLYTEYDACVKKIKKLRE